MLDFVVHTSTSHSFRSNLTHFRTTSHSFSSSGFGIFAKGATSLMRRRPHNGHVVMSLQNCLHPRKASIWSPVLRNYRHSSDSISPWGPILRFCILLIPANKSTKGKRDMLFTRSDHVYPTAVFPRFYQPARYLSNDEMMIGTRFRVSFLQYIPKKIHSFWHKGLGKLRGENRIRP